MGAPICDLFLSGRRGQRKYCERPGSCSLCGLPGWWNGTRAVSQVKLRSASAGIVTEHITENIRRRACCSGPECPAPSWTVYEFGEYPGRSFDLQVVSLAVSAVVLGKKTLSEVATIFDCSRRSVRRWCAWVAGLVDTQVLARTCALLHPEGMGVVVPALADTNQVALVLSLLEQWVLITTTRGLALPGQSTDPGWVRVLSDQLNRFNVTIFLHSSPPLRIEPPPDWG